MERNIVFLLLLFATHVIQALAGFGGTMLAMPPSILLVGADTAKVVLNMVALILSVVIVAKEYRAINWRELLKIVVGMLIGMQIGILIYERFPLDMLLRLYGAVIIAIACKNLFFASPGERRIPKIVLLLTLLAAGVIHGMFVSGGALLVVYASAVLKDKRAFRATISGVWIVTDTFLMVTQIRGGLFHSSNGKLLLAALLPLAVSVVLGNWLHQKINQQVFMRLTYVLLIVSGCVALF